MIKLVPIFASLLIGTAFAQTPQDCYEAEMTQADMNRCAGEKNREMKALFARLIVDLKMLLPEEPIKHLLASQKYWEQLVREDCSIEAWYLDGGSARSMIIAGCYTEHTRIRIKMLAPLLCHPMKLTCDDKDKYEQNL